VIQEIFNGFSDRRNLKGDDPEAGEMPGAIRRVRWWISAGKTGRETESDLLK